MGEGDQQHLGVVMIAEDCKVDFKEVTAFYKEHPKASEVFATAPIRNTHNTVYSYLVLSGGIRVTNDAWAFASEIRSDYLQMIPLMVTGHQKLLWILLRDVIENSLKFIYYYHHPIELELLEVKTKNYVSFEELSRYACEHPRLSQHAAKMNLLSRVKDFYSEYSRYTHSKDVNYMHLVRYLKEISFDATWSLEYSKQLKGVHSLISSMLILFSLDKWGRMGADEKRFVLSSMSISDKRYLVSI